MINKTENPSKVETFQESKILYAEIVQGYSRIVIPKEVYDDNDSDEEIIFWKHLTEIDNAKTLLLMQEYEKEGLDVGVKKEKDKLKELSEIGIWTEENEKKTQELRESVNFGRQQMSKLALKSQRETYQKDIDQKQKLLDEEMNIREEVLDLTAETYASKKINRNLTMDFLFKDEALKQPLITEEDIEESDDIIWKYALQTSMQRDWFSDLNLKKIAIWPFFLNGFFMLGDDSSNYYRTPICEWTTHQQGLITAGRWLKGILSQTDKSPPESLYDNLDDLVNWYQGEQAKIERKNKASKQKPDRNKVKRRT